jgi:hypothetical protein
LIKMSPVSEYLTVNNNYATNLKYSIGSPFSDSQLANNNIWLSNTYSDNSNPLSSLNLSLINQFEDSRLWNQKRNFFTVLPKLAFTKQKEILSEDKISFNNQRNYKFLLLSLNLNYLGVKDNLLVNLENDLGVLNSKGTYLSHISNPSLNLWNALDNYHITSICSTSNTETRQGYYDYTTSSLNYKTL